MNVCIMWSRVNVANWENGKGGKSSSKLWEKEVLKIILALCKLTDKNKNSPELIGSGLWRAV